MFKCRFKNVFKNMINKFEAICTNMYNKCPLQRQKKNRQQMELCLVDFGVQKNL